MDINAAVEELRALAQGLRTHTSMFHIHSIIYSYTHNPTLILLPSGGTLPDPSPLPHFSHILPTSALRGEGVEMVKAALRDVLAQEDVTEHSNVHIAK